MLLNLKAWRWIFYIKVKNEKFFYKKVRWVNCKFTEAKIDFIDYKDTSLLKY